MLDVNENTMAKIYLIRHGQSTYNTERRWAGHADPPLTELGREQAKVACETFKDMGFSAATSSSLQRARETASIISNELHIDLLEPISELNERHAGQISGLTSDEIEQRFPGFLDKWRKGEIIDIPGGEEWESFHHRVQQGLDKLSVLPGRIVVVAHEGVLRTAEFQLGKKQQKHHNLEGIWI